MAYSEKLAERIRKALAHLPDVQEKKMFGSLAFMVNGKMCLTAGPGRMMCRIDPVLHKDAVAKEGCQTVIMRGREYRGYVHVSEDSLGAETEFNYWIELVLNFNKNMH